MVVDLVDLGVVWFAEMGSPPLELQLLVSEANPASNP